MAPMIRFAYLLLSVCLGLSLVLLSPEAHCAPPETPPVSPPRLDTTELFTFSGVLTPCAQEFRPVGGPGNSIAFPVYGASTASGGLWLRSRSDPWSKSGDLQAFALPLPETLPNHLPALWSAQKELAEQTFVDRRIFTIFRATSLSQTFLPGTEATRERLSERWRSAPEGTRDLLSRFGQQALGTIIHSTPVRVGAPPLLHSKLGYDAFRGRNQHREPIVYVAANDGMLHAFYAERHGATPAGRQSWAYLPHALLDHVPEMLDEPHRYRLDLSPLVHDVWHPQWDPGRNDATHGDGDGWRTVLVGGAGRGGEFYFSLDITDPAANRVKPLWEKTPFPGARASNKPVVGPLAPNGQWAALLTSGYRTDRLPGAVAALDPATGSKLPLWNSGAARASQVKTRSRSVSAAYYSITEPVAIDSNQDGMLDLAYAGDSEGILWKFYFDPSFQQWCATARFDTGGRGISARPTVVTDREGNLRIYFGTGLDLNEEDRRDTSSQGFFCLIERPQMLAPLSEERYTWAPCQPQTPKDLLNVTGLNSRTAIASLREDAIATLDRQGWWIELNTAHRRPAERVLSAPIILAGKVFFTSYTPGNTACSKKGFTRLYAVEHDSGLQARIASRTVLRKTGGGELPAGRRHGYRTEGRASPLQWIFPPSEKPGYLLFKSGDGQPHQIVPDLGLLTLSLRAWREIGF